MKNGEKKTINCPEAICCYNKYMGGVDLSDQLTAFYDLDRKSTKWWRKVLQITSDAGSQRVNNL